MTEQDPDEVAAAWAVAQEALATLAERIGDTDEQAVVSAATQLLARTARLRLGMVSPSTVVVTAQAHLTLQAGAMLTSRNGRAAAARHVALADNATATDNLTVTRTEAEEPVTLAELYDLHQIMLKWTTRETGPDVYAALVVLLSFISLLVSLYSLRP